MGRLRKEGNEFFSFDVDFCYYETGRLDGIIPGL